MRKSPQLYYESFIHLMKQIILWKFMSHEKQHYQLCYEYSYFLLENLHMLLHEYSWAFNSNNHFFYADMHNLIPYSLPDEEE